MDNQTATVYDGAGRVTASIFQPGGRENWSGGRSAVRSLAESCAVNAFSAGTLVLMADGSKKLIEQVKAGDKVSSFTTHVARWAQPKSIRLYIVSGAQTWRVGLRPLGSVLVAGRSQHRFRLSQRGGIAK